MHLLYLDDSGSTVDASQSYFVLAGISVYERQTYFISQKLDDIAARIIAGDPKDIEFHASVMYHGKKPPWRGMSKLDRRNVIKEVLQVLRDSHKSTRAFACAVRKASFPRADSSLLAFEELCNRFDLRLKRLHDSGDTQRGLIILDRSSDERTIQRLADSFRETGTRWRIIRNLADVPLFVDSEASRLIQLADHIAYAVYRRYESGDTSFFDIIASKFDRDEGVLHGLVHKQPFDPHCMCPACMSRRD